MEFEWDPIKAALNLRKHGIDLADATGVFDDDRARTMLDDHPDEERFVTIGCDSFGRILVVVFAWRVARVRLISARRATRRERHEYLG